MRILKEGIPFIVPCMIAGLAFLAAAVFFKFMPKPAFISCIALGSVLVVFSLFCCFFFRDPKINITQGDGLILSPCNGTVMEVADENTEQGANEKIVRVFLSVFSVHLQRSPVSGTVMNVVHKPGKFLAAWDPKAHIENEQNIFTIKNEKGVFTVKQVAGLVARRCVSWVKPGDSLKIGGKIGMIKFSSQVDLYMPKTAEVTVKPGDKVKAGITIMARI